MLSCACVGSVRPNSPSPARSETGRSVRGDVHTIDVPTLLINGAHDEAQDSVVAPFFHAVRKVRWFTFAASGHMPQFEEREKYMQIVGSFLDED